MPREALLRRGTVMMGTLFIYVLDGLFEIAVDGQWQSFRAGDMLTMKSSTVMDARDGSDADFVKLVVSQISLSRCHRYALNERNLSRAEDPDAMRASWFEVTPLKRQGTAEDVAKAILFLACDDSDFITGTPLIIDGGRLAQ